jgi:hypothetical protein
MGIKEKKIGNTVVWMDFADCPSDGGKYQIVCEKHGYLIQGDNKRNLWGIANEVWDWCAACAGQDNRYPNDKWEAQ